MNFLEFRNELKDFPVFGLNDIKKIPGKVYHHRLIEWQKKNFIQRLANETYFFRDQQVNEHFLFYAANIIYGHSYVSLESALSYYGFIPEGVYRVTSVSALKTSTFNTSLGLFEYRKVKKIMMFGYTLIPFRNVNIRIAEPEKALIDYFYLNPQLDSEDHFYELRINTDSFSEKVSRDKLQLYLDYISNKKLILRMKRFLKWMDNAVH